MHSIPPAVTKCDVFLTGTKPDLSKQYYRDLIDHEAVHKTQWYWSYKKTGLWFGYVLLYMAEGVDPCDNYYEQQADLKKGHYEQCS